MTTEIIAKAKKWLTEPFDIDTQNEVKSLIESTSDELTESFYKDLEFGTGGLRGIMGVGTNRINKYTIGQATQGLANYIKKSFPNQDTSVAIAFDSRNNSDFFAKTAARVLSANGIKVYLFENLRPTPELSYAVRHFQCKAGIVITASHNPKEYNGYKVYWSDGGQLVPPHDKNVIDEVRSISFENIQFTQNDNLIEYIGKTVDDLYLDKISGLSFQDYANKGGNNTSIVYTSIHGTGITLIPDALEKVGFTNIHVIEEQQTPNGNFPTVESPNPEEKAALDIAIQKAIEIDGDVVLGTDPDTDRVGMVVKHNGEFHILNGNQSATILVYYLLENWKKKNQLKGKEFIAKTIVTTTLLDKMASDYSVECVNTLTGFKYIAEEIRLNEGKKQFIGGGEESYGYLVGDFVRDKDAVISTVLLCEAAAWAKENGQTLIDLLNVIYNKYGLYQEQLVSITKKGKSGAEEIQAMMEDYRANIPAEIAGSKVSVFKDYRNGVVLNKITNTTDSTGLPTSNVLQFELENGSVITARPSGTEPKIKFYFSVNEKVDTPEDLEKTKKQLTSRIQAIKESLSI